MAAITARGIYEGRRLEVICIERDGKLIFLFDKHKDEHKQRALLQEMKKRYPFAGTYIPAENSILNALNVLSYYFFDELTDVETTGTFEEMPHEDGVVY